MRKRRTARETALDLLISVTDREAYSNVALNRELEASGLLAKDRRLVTELVYGTLQRRGTLDWVLTRLVKKGPDSLQDWVRELLRMSLYQLLFLDRIPERAAVHEAVEIAKRRGHAGIAKLVNGVLRAWGRRKEELLPPVHPRTMEEKVAAWSAPAWLIRGMEQAYGEEAARRSLELCLTPPDVSVRVNRLKMDRETFIARWNESMEGAAEASSVAPEGVLIRRGGNPASSDLFRQGACTVQDESSMLVARAVSPKGGMKVLDMCAAPGGKTTHLAELMGNEGRVLAFDVHAHKVERIREHVRRLGLSVVEAAREDARTLPDRFGEEFDAVLLDAPCSGLGVIRRKPDIKWSKDAEDSTSLVPLQRELLDAAAKLVKPGGTLVYSTCTWEPEENVRQVEAFLARHSGFMPDDSLSRLLPEAVAKTAITGSGWVQILPHHFGSDGFFIARLRKAGSP
ncbi:16S rRNA (cytosine(967)-C(5))-methyltransferase RsmB [Staphylospora marina]|uniref:16S rRNA (cytosine(967)-C(5))-methyltransferase RsmB n=1 Tax=Staphylospora marina TaxID=2490858 RepID=UPI000F5C0A3A|nr:16S rRNA (cytosine(967)-C(5))-methyltransferase RsmB [Staphylospora marina]